MKWDFVAPLHCAKSPHKPFGFVTLNIFLKLVNNLKQIYF